MGNVEITYYCGRDCQTAHWAEHKSECKAKNARKVVFRTDDLLYLCSAAFLLRLPGGVPSITDYEKHRAFLFLANMASPVAMHEMLRSALQDTAICEEVAVQLKGPLNTGLLNMQEACLNPLVATCIVQRARICDDSTFALDIIAPHYGHSLAVLPWQEFADKNIVGVLEIAEFGHHIRHFEAGFEVALMHVREDGDMDIEGEAWLLIGDRRAFTKMALKAG
ncbi:hypothetical protein LTR95_007623 [Oleoguttula sp. CCFEE 5521]